MSTRDGAASELLADVEQAEHNLKLAQEFIDALETDNTRREVEVRRLEERVAAGLESKTRLAKLHFEAQTELDAAVARVAELEKSLDRARKDIVLCGVDKSKADGVSSREQTPTPIEDRHRGSGRSILLQNVRQEVDDLKRNLAAEEQSNAKILHAITLERASIKELERAVAEMKCELRDMRVRREGEKKRELCASVLDARNRRLRRALAKEREKLATLQKRHRNVLSEEDGESADALPVQRLLIDRTEEDDNDSEDLSAKAGDNGDFASDSADKLSGKDGDWQAPERARREKDEFELLESLDPMYVYFKLTASAVKLRLAAKLPSFQPERLNGLDIAALYKLASTEGRGFHEWNAWLQGQFIDHYLRSAPDTVGALAAVVGNDGR